MPTILWLRRDEDDARLAAITRLPHDLDSRISRTVSEIVVERETLLSVDVVSDERQLAFFEVIDAIHPKKAIPTCRTVCSTG